MSMDEMTAYLKKVAGPDKPNSGNVSPEDDPPVYLREKAAAEYLRARYGHGAAKTLSKLRVIGGGPEFRKAGRLVVYTREALDKWAASKLSRPLRSTSEVCAAA
jgi:hypothetical protein